MLGKSSEIAYVFRPKLFRVVNFSFSMESFIFAVQSVCNAVGIPVHIGTNKCPLLSFAQGSHIAERTASLVGDKYLDDSLVERLRKLCDVGQTMNLDIWMSLNKIL